MINTDQQPYVEAGKIEGYWGDLVMGVQVLVSFPRPLTREEGYIVSRHVEAIREELAASHKRSNPEAQQKKAELTQAFRDLFGGRALYMSETPNQYCRQSCCVMIPWFKAVTSLGVITLGWRKRVISIDWSESEVKATAQELFPDENVTKEGRLIHAWGYDKAKEYIDKLHQQITASKSEGRP